MPSSKEHGHVRQLLSSLAERGWQTEEIVEVTEWWANSVWKLKSVKQSFGLNLYITALTNRMAATHQSDAIECIRASSEIPNGFYDQNGVISECHTSSRGFEKRLDQFLAEIEIFRNDSSQV